MSRLVSLLNRLIGSTRRDREAAELDEEMRFHREMLERDAVTSGVDPATAPYAAKRRFGNQTFLREESADMWRIQAVETIAQDVRYAIRFLRRTPVFTAVGEPCRPGASLRNDGRRCPDDADHRGLTGSRGGDCGFDPRAARGEDRSSRMLRSE